MRFDILSIFPDIFSSYVSESLFARAIKKSLLQIKIHDLRKWSRERHRKVDDRPFGGGPGMVFQVEPIHRAVEAIQRQTKKLKRRRIILFSTRGKKLDANTAKRLSKYDQLTLICGRYEGVDERVADHIADEEISIGDYVLSGGELPALVLMEAISRFKKGFLGTRESLEEIKGFYPVYTRPASFTPKSGKRSWKVPEVLLRGNHAAIDVWRRKYGEDASRRIHA
ncbi:MAG: tRNA (guanosine(37)-N1)-methyltransferase TrmD [Candidatus Liptonbacteria bacterium]|nr:tRNA (guanosine(37)-N1)-methyltransferase TrmD [Candidatus Liptonbacteria bacterium]